MVDTGRRRRWSFEEKLRIVEESHQGHRQVSATARRHGISASLLFSWRRDFREGRLGGVDVGDLVPAAVLPEPVSSSEPVGEPAAVGTSSRKKLRSRVSHRRET